jgi:hypothetical protein
MLEGFFRSPRSISTGERSHEVRSVPPQAFTRCGLAWGRAVFGRLRVGAGEKSGLFEHPVRAGALVLDVCNRSSALLKQF